MELLETKQVIFSAKRLKMLLNLCRLNLTKDLLTLSSSLVDIKVDHKKCNIVYMLENVFC